jgi:ABC-type antimicrobial peptide transport system permease subunit
MSNFRNAQEHAHPNKTSTLTLAIIVIQILLITIQVWLLYSGLNNTLEHNKAITIPALAASFALFLVCCGLLYFLPRRRAYRK